MVVVDDVDEVLDVEDVVVPLPDVVVVEPLMGSVIQVLTPNTVITKIAINNEIYPKRFMSPPQFFYNYNMNEEKIKA